MIALVFASAWCASTKAQTQEDGEIIQDLNAQHFEDALAKTEGSLKVRPQEPFLWTFRGVALGGLGKTDESLRSFDKALQLNPRFVPALKAAAQLTYQNHNARASVYLQRLLVLEPNEPAANAMAGVLDFEAHRCSSAVARFEKSSQLVLTNSASATEYAACLLATQKDAVAIHVLKQAYELHPSSRNLRYDLALAEFDGGQRDDALAVLQSGQDDDAGVVNLRATIESEKGDLESAAKDFKLAIEMDPQDARSYLDLAVLGLDHDRIPLAVDVLTAGIARMPEYAEFYSVRGIAYVQLSRDEEAQRDFARAAELDPKKPLAAMAKTVLDVQMDHPEQAQAALRRQLQKTPNDAVANTLLANLLIRGGAAPGTANFAEAKAALERALKANPNLVEALVSMGQLRSDDGDLPGALTYFGRALARDPTNRDALNHSLMIDRKLGRKEDAAKVAEKLTAQVSGEVRRRDQSTVRTDSAR
ncbi:MAG TPA: tetratricopeptide repeat protein [Terracidiphilus sp.]|nr:tetratricopeptide repeat protein [Terracidiphilus sp.]